MKLQVLNGHTMKPLPGATVKIQTKRMHRHSPSHIPILKSEHITDANGEVVEYGTLNGVYSYRVFKTHRGDIFRVKFDERIRRAKCVDEACEECEVNMKVMAEKQEQSLVITPCTCKGELKIINKNTKLPVRGACVAYHLQADCQQIDTDYPGNDIDAVLNVSSWQNCSSICSNNSKCKFWTWIDSNYENNPNIHFKCHLKESNTVKAKIKG